MTDTTQDSKLLARVINAHAARPFTNGEKWCATLAAQLAAAQRAEWEKVNAARRAAKEAGAKSNAADLEDQRQVEAARQAAIDAENAAKAQAKDAAIVEKTGAQPFVSTSLTLRNNGQWQIYLYGPRVNEKYDIGKATGESPELCFVQAFEIIAALPDPEIKAKHDWQCKLGDMIDEGHALNLPDDVMTPLRGASQAMAENLNEGPKA